MYFQTYAVQWVVADFGNITYLFNFKDKCILTDFLEPKCNSSERQMLTKCLDNNKT